MKTVIDYKDIERHCLTIAKQISRDKWVPDYVVGITRGGLLPAVLLSNWFDCKMYTLDVRLRDGKGDGCESNLWMPEDAVGYVPVEDRGDSGTTIDPAYRKNILIVDDINDTGATLNWIKHDWQTSCMPNHSAWDTVWSNNVRVATLFDRGLASNSEIPKQYSSYVVTQDNDPGWIVFPWENWCGDE